MKSPVSVPPQRCGPPGQGWTCFDGHSFRYPMLLQWPFLQLFSIGLIGVPFSSGGADCPEATLGGTEPFPPS